MAAPRGIFGREEAMASSLFAFGGLVKKTEFPLKTRFWVDKVQFAGLKTWGRMFIWGYVILI
jgi:hypothetical protein